MRGWGEVTLAVLRGGLGAIPLGADERDEVLEAVDGQDAEALGERAEAALREASGSARPFGALSAEREEILLRRAHEAWSRIPARDRKEMRNLARLIAKEEELAERTGLIGDLSEQLVGALLKHAPLRRVIAQSTMRQPRLDPSDLQPETAPIDIARQETGPLPGGDDPEASEGTGEIGPGTLLAGKFLLKEKLGEGGYGSVYRAQHRDLSKDVAIKILKPSVATNDEARKRFLREVELTTAFVHKYAVQLREFGRDSELGVLYQSMDLIEGQTLHDLLKERKVIAPERAVRIACQTLEVLEEAHRSGLVHRDLKPGNLMLVEGRRGEEVRVLDFGIAKAIGSARKSTALTMAGKVIGTPLYMSPEQAEGAALDGRSDLYALGVVLFQCLADTYPVIPDPRARNPQKSFLLNLLTKPPRDLLKLAPGTPPRLAKVVMQALAKKPADRFSDAAAFRRALEGLGATLDETGPVEATPAPPKRQPKPPPPSTPKQATRTKKPRRGRGRLVVAGVFGSCLFLLGFMGSGAVWGPPLYRAIARELRDPRRVAEAEQARAQADQLERQCVALAHLLEVPAPSGLEAATTAGERGREALEAGDLEGALEAFQEARRTCAAGLNDLAAAERARAEKALESWAPLSRAFQLRPPQRLSLARRRLAEGIAELESERPYEAAVACREAVGIYRDALRTVDLAPPVLTITRPLAAATTRDRVRVEGRVRDATRVEVEIDGRRVQELEAEGAGSYRFAVDVPLVKLGPRTIEIRARDDAARETLLRSKVERKPLPLEIELTAPAAGAVTRAEAVTVRGRVTGSVAARELLLNGEPVTLEKAAFVHTVPLAEGKHRLELIARGPLAEGRVVREVVVDRTPPVVEVAGLPEGAVVATQQVRLRVRVRDASPWVVVRLPGEAPRRIEPNVSTVITLVAREGKNVYPVLATDAAGNQSPLLQRTVVRRAAPELLRSFEVAPGRYRIVSSLTIPAGQTLELSAGARLEFSPGAALVCKGQLRAQGTQLMPVVFAGKPWGGVRVEPGAQATLAHAVVRGARAESGAGIEVHQAKLTMSDSRVEDCRATKYGGGIRLLGTASRFAVGTLTRVTFARNHAMEGGGLNLNLYARAILEGCAFLENASSGYGGGMSTVGGGRANPTVATLIDCRFEKNRAERGAGLIVGRASSAQLKGGRFTANVARKAGGGAYVIGQAGQPASLVGKLVRFEKNRAPEGAGANVNNDATARFEGGAFVENRGRLGGALIVIGVTGRRSEVTCVQVTFQKNRASLEGGAINLNRSSGGTFKRCVFASNGAGTYGGGVMAYGGPRDVPQTRLVLERCSFRGNTSTKPRSGPDLRVERFVVFDQSQLAGSGLTDPGRYSVLR